MAVPSNQEMADHFISSAKSLKAFRYGLKHHPRLAESFRQSDKYFALITAELEKHLRLLDPANPIDLTEEELVFALNDPRSLKEVQDPAGCQNLRDVAGWLIVASSPSFELLSQVAELCSSVVEQRAIKLAHSLYPNNQELASRSLTV